MRCFYLIANPTRDIGLTAAHMIETYLKERGLSDETIRKFGLGFTGRSGGLYRFLKSKDFSDEMLQESGTKEKTETAPEPQPETADAASIFSSPSGRSSPACRYPGGD